MEEQVKKGGSIKRAGDREMTLLQGGVDTVYSVVPVTISRQLQLREVNRY
jgi:hypothetical protein